MEVGSVFLPYIQTTGKFNKKIEVILCKLRKLREVSLILPPLHKLRSTQITDLIFTSAKRLLSSIPLALSLSLPLSLHSRQQTLYAPVLKSGIRFAHELATKCTHARLGHLSIKYCINLTIFP